MHQGLAMVFGSRNGFDQKPIRLLCLFRKTKTQCNTSERGHSGHKPNQNIFVCSCLDIIIARDSNIRSIVVSSFSVYFSTVDKNTISVI